MNNIKVLRNLRGKKLFAYVEIYLKMVSLNLFHTFTFLLKIIFKKVVGVL